jgi:predicted alpha/beta hydrolase
MSAEDATLAAADGRRLAATFHLPEGVPLLAVQINPGLGVPRGFYRAMATWLAARGCAVLTFDNRGVGGSVLADGAGRDDFAMSDWGRLDQAAASAALRGRFPAAPLVLVAHSKGAQLMGFNPLLGEARAAFTVASQYFGWTHKDWPGRLRMWREALWRMPVSLHRLGHYPLPAMFDLPPRAAREMQRWYLSRHYFCDERGGRLRPHNHDLRAPLRHVVYTDDELIRRRQQAEGLLELYPNAAGTFEHADPMRHGVAAIGHFGFFRRSMPEAAWQDMFDWLVAHAR